MVSNQPKVVFKILILGDAMVGKSCFLQRYADGKYTDTIAPTIGVDYRPVYKEFRGQLTKLMIWDTAGQEKFKSITKSFYHGAHGAIFVYDITQKDSLNTIPKWISEMEHVCGNIPVLVVGNKNDSKTSKSPTRMTEEEVSTFMEEKGLSDRHILVSARTGDNVDKAFEMLASILMDSVDSALITSEKNRLNIEKNKSSGRCAC